MTERRYEITIESGVEASREQAIACAARRLEAGDQSDTFLHTDLTDIEAAKDEDCGVYHVTFTFEYKFCSPVYKHRFEAELFEMNSVVDVSSRRTNASEQQTAG
jgi:hypothetical protein